jgi:hypothetical protein
MMSIDLFGKIKVSWTKQDLLEINFVNDVHKDINLNNLYINAGHSIQNMNIGLCQQHRDFPAWALQVKDHFNLNNVTVALHKISPGNYLPIHADLYGNYKRIYNITNENICRVIVFLEDWQPGHMLDINNTIYNSWQAGDYFGWINDTPHAAYNFGLKDRYTLQITGTA